MEATADRPTATWNIERGLRGRGALTKCSHILGWKERRYYSAQRGASVPNGTDKLVIMRLLNRASR